MTGLVKESCLRGLGEMAARFILGLPTDRATSSSTVEAPFLFYDLMPLQRLTPHVEHLWAPSITLSATQESDMCLLYGRHVPSQKHADRSSLALEMYDYQLQTINSVGAVHRALVACAGMDYQKEFWVNWRKRREKKSSDWQRFRKFKEMCVAFDGAEKGISAPFHFSRSSTSSCAPLQY
ncbi:unnamed protein product [Toxocara canis]|uniref:Uncharacterized protein n=1 Tax=Toxocara canis TaxID=6265 RepID=A0A183UFP8_TOXCA|nr:unnamed protein product [Toxocara canis]